MLGARVPARDERVERALAAVAERKLARLGARAAGTACKRCRRSLGVEGAAELVGRTDNEHAGRLRERPSSEPELGEADLGERAVHGVGRAAPIPGTTGRRS